MCFLVAITHIPNETFFVSCQIKRISHQTIICLVVCQYISLYFSFGKHRSRKQINHSGHCIGAEHQTSRTFQYLSLINRLFINFDSVFITPLLSFLAYAIIYNHHAIISQTTNNRFGDTATGSDL